MVHGLDTPAVQARLERLRIRAGGRKTDDETLVTFAQAELSELEGPTSRALLRLKSLADRRARDFADRAGLQGIVMGDWVEFAHSPGDTGWTRSQIAVREMPVRMVFVRGKGQSWLREKKAFLRERWPVARGDPALRRALAPNGLKVDLVGLEAVGTKDSPICVISTAPIDWLTCASLNSRLDSRPMTVDPSKPTVREQWGEPGEVARRRALPGMIVAHIVVETIDRRFLVCERHTAGMEDEPGTWSLSIEERWAAAVPRAGSLAVSDGDRHPHDVVRRGCREELGIDVDDSEIRVLSWGIETSVLYPGFIAIARTARGSWEVEGLRAQASDANEVRFVSSVPAEIKSLSLLDEAHFSPPGKPDLRRRWHRTSKARLYTALAHVLTDERNDGRARLLADFGGRRPYGLTIESDNVYPPRESP